MDAVDVTASVRKVSRIGDAEDAPSQLPSYRTHQERPSPAPGHRKGNIGPRPQADLSSGDPFLTPTGPAPSVNSDLSLPAIGAEPANRRSAQRAERNRDRSISPTASRARSHGLNTGRDGTDVASLEDGEVREPPILEPEQEEDAPMPDASAGDDAGAGDENFSALGAEDEDANDDPAPLDPQPQQGQQYAAIAAAAHGNGLHPQVYLFANAPGPAPVPAPIAPQNATITAPQMTPYPQPAPAPLAQHAPFPGFPTRDQLANKTPTHRDLNPHRNAPPEPVVQLQGPADLDRPRRQRNEGHFRRKVVAIHKYLENAQPGLAKAILKNPGNYLFLPLVNGGRVAFDKLSKANGNDLVGKIAQIISGEASEDEIQVFDLGRVNADYGGTYGGPFAFAAKINSPAAAARMLAVDTYGHSEDISFSVVQADPSLFPWVVSIHKVPGARTPAAQEAACRTFRGVLGETIIATPPLRLAIDRASPPDDTRSSDIRLLELIRSIDPRWDPLMNAIVTYARPCTTDAVIWETVIDALCGLTLTDDELLIFEPMLETGSAGNDPRCVLCKNECHFAQGCPLTKSGMTWWGAKDQIKNVTSGALAGRGRGGGNRGGGRGAQGNTYNRGGFRGNGGGGFNGNGNGGGRGGRGRGGRGRGS